MKSENEEDYERGRRDARDNDSIFGVMGDLLSPLGGKSYQKGYERGERERGKYGSSRKSESESKPDRSYSRSNSDSIPMSSSDGDLGKVYLAVIPYVVGSWLVFYFLLLPQLRDGGAVPGSLEWCFYVIILILCFPGMIMGAIAVIALALFVALIALVIGVLYEIVRAIFG